jgi:CRISPR-associated endonuclease/helicase Cas3
LPVELLEPVVSLLQGLAKHCRVSVVLCTATQPALSHERWGFDPAPREIVPQYREHFERLTRVNYERAQEPWGWDRLADEVATCEQCLVVLNTKAHAIKVLRALLAGGAADQFGLVHLSTRLTGSHRRRVLEDVRRRLHDGLPCRLISTQVVEAGVDLDFPVVMRAVGPLDRIVQAAGRCNREGRLDEGRALGRVVVFNPEETGMPRGTYRTASAQAQSLLCQAGVDLNDPATYEDYFRLLYQLTDCDQRKIQPLREAFDYPEVAQRGHLIKTDTVAVVVPDAPGGDVPGLETLPRMLDRIKTQAAAGYGISAQDWRKLQPHVINLWPYEAARHAGELEEIAPGVTVWHGGYDALEGIRLDGPAVEDLVVDKNSA